MKKELLWAIITGFGLGLVITWGIISARRAVQPAAPQDKVIEEVNPTPLASAISLVINTPLTDSITDQEKISLAGKTKPKAVVTVFTEEKEQIIEADEKGAFQTEIELVAGANQITVYAFDLESGAEASQSVSLVYSTAEI